MPVKVGPIYDRRDCAGFFRRTLALAIDFLIISLVMTAVLWGWRSLALSHWVTRDVNYWVYGGLTVLASAYLIGFRLTPRGTPGYRLMRIRYAYMLAEKPTVLTILFRAFVAVVLTFGFVLDHVWILFDERRQTWHDKMSGFYVIKAGAQPVATGRMVQRVVNFWSFTFVVWEPANEGVTLAHRDRALEPVGIDDGKPGQPQS